jgi:hypothetical protein
MNRKKAQNHQEKQKQINIHIFFCAFSWLKVAYDGSANTFQPDMFLCAFCFFLVIVLAEKTSSLRVLTPLGFAVSPLIGGMPERQGGQCITVFIRRSNNKTP